MANELKPCPFCQTQPIVSENNVPGNWYAVAECDNSECSERPGIYGDDLADAKAKWNNGDAWNTRPATPVEGLVPCVSLHVSSTDTYPDLEVEVHDGAYIQPSDSPIPMVTKAQAAAVIAAKDAYTKEVLLDYRKYVKLAEKLEADNAALTARVKELEGERTMIVSHATMGGTDGVGLSVNDISVRVTALRNELYDEGKKRAEALETQLAAARKVLKTLIELNDSSGPFGGEIYHDRVDSAWSDARAALEDKP